MTVSAKVRARLPASRLGKPGSDGYPMPDKKHARIAKGFAAMHNDPDKAAIDAKANAVLAKKRGGLVVGGKGKKPSLGRAGRAGGGKSPQSQPTPQFNPLQQQPGPSPAPEPESQFTPPTKHFPTLGPMFRTSGAMYT
jgi:hypothetical protein